jgi:mRNA interferase MazF
MKKILTAWRKIYEKKRVDIFDVWNEKKKTTHQSYKIPYFNIGEIWWIQLGKNISSESTGKGEDFLRPAIVLQKLYGTSALVVPLTSQKREGSYYFSFLDNQSSSQTAILSQMRYVDGKRLKRQLSSIPTATFQTIQNKIIELIKNNPQPEGGGS